MRDRRLTPYLLRLKAPSRTLRRDPTPTERKLWFEFLRELPDKFPRQPLGSYIADFYCSRLRLVIEIDGDSHFMDRGEAHDGVIRFTNAEVMEQFEDVCSRIEQALAEQQ